jgi:pilus assembly protein Flp/PilA
MSVLQCLQGPDAINRPGLIGLPMLIDSLDSEVQVGGRTLRIRWEAAVRGCAASVRSFLRDDDGAALVEYTVVVGILVLLSIAMLGAVGSWVNGQWSMLNRLVP